MFTLESQYVQVHLAVLAASLVFWMHIPILNRYYIPILNQFLYPRKKQQLASELAAAENHYREWTRLASKRSVMTHLKFPTDDSRLVVPSPAFIGDEVQFLEDGSKKHTQGNDDMSCTFVGKEEREIWSYGVMPRDCDYLDSEGRRFRLRPIGWRLAPVRLFKLENEALWHPSMESTDLNVREIIPRWMAAGSRRLQQSMARVMG